MLLRRKHAYKNKLGISDEKEVVKLFFELVKHQKRLEIKKKKQNKNRNIKQFTEH